MSEYRIVNITYDIALIIYRVHIDWVTVLRTYADRGGGHWHAAIALTTLEPFMADQPTQLRGRQDGLTSLTRDDAKKRRVPAFKRRHSQPAYDQIVFSSDFAGRLIEISTTYYAYTGGKQIAPSHWIVFPAIHKRDKASVRAGWQAAINEGGAFTADFRLLGVDGGSRWFRLHSTPSPIVSGALRSWSSVCVDIDDLKREHLVLRASEARARRKCADQHVILMMWHKLQSELSAAAELHAVGRLAATLAQQGDRSDLPGKPAHNRDPPCTHPRQTWCP